jgi:Xaa-Pro dipeptidase
MHASRLEKLMAALGLAGLDAVALNPGPTLTYLTGLRFHLMERPVVLLVAPGKDPVIVLPELETPKVGQLPYKVTPVSYGENPADWDAAFRRAVTLLQLDGKRIGVEPRHMRLLEFRHVRAGAPEADYPDASETLALLRLHKDEAEVEEMRHAVRAAQEALKATLPFIRTGATEREIAAELNVQLVRGGSDSELPFAPIVSSGPNSANPHASPSDRKLQQGDLLVVDWGANVNGYASDLTRTFGLGEVEPEFKKIAEIVLAANEAGRRAGKPGVACAAVDEAARDVIERSGYGKYFTHRTGHGLGMEDHEEPYMYAENQKLLEPGMAYTVEPGIYLPGRGGVRIEDNVVVTNEGVEVLSDMPRELRVVG